MRLTGKRAFIWQNISAAYLALYTPYLAWLALTIKTHTDLFTPSVLMPSLLAIGLLLIHAWVGLRDVMIDYLPRRSLAWWLPSLLITLVLIALNLTWLLLKGFSL